MSDLPGNWTDLANGAPRPQIENILAALGEDRGVTIYLDGKPVAVLLSIEDYRSLRGREPK